MHSSRKKEDFELASHYLKKADKIIRDLNDEFTWYDFESRFFSRRQPNGGPADFLVSIGEYAEKARQEGRIKTFLNLRGNLNRVKVFHKRKRLPMHHITPGWVTAFHESLVQDGLRISSIGILVRNIRTVFNW